MLITWDYLQYSFFLEFKLKRIICLIIALLLISCAMMPEIKNWYDYDDSKIPTWAMNSIDDMIQFVYSGKYIKYVGDPENWGVSETVDYFATPDETLSHMAGDCDDQALLLLAMIWKKYHKKGQLIFAKIKGKDTYHVYVFYHHHNYTTGLKIDYQKYVVNFDDVDEWINTAHTIY
jgi:hypothetical protein